MAKTTYGLTNEGCICVSRIMWAVALDGADCFATGRTGQRPAATFHTRAEARAYATEAMKGGGRWTPRKVKVTVCELSQ